MDPLDRSSAFPASAAAAERVTSFLRAVYGWMCVGLGITAFVAYTIAASPALIGALVSNHFLFLGLFLAQLGVVFFLSARVDRLAPGTATGLFVLYSGLTGVTLSVILLAYTGASIATRLVATEDGSGRVGRLERVEADSGFPPATRSNHTTLKHDSTIGRFRPIASFFRPPRPLAQGSRRTPRPRGCRRSRGPGRSAPRRCGSARADRGWR